MVVVNLSCECADWQSLSSPVVIHSGRFLKVNLCVCVKSGRGQPFDNFQNLLCDALLSLLG